MSSGLSSSISPIEQSNLLLLDRQLRQHWNLGEQIALCWSYCSTGIQVLLAPHYYLANFSTSLNDCAPSDRLEALNGRFIRQLISGSRRLDSDEFIGTARRFQLSPIELKLPVELGRSEAVIRAVDELISRYSINYVKSRAVLLFDIVDFSLATPFEQTSQLNSLNFSMNAACKRLLDRGIEVDFCRTTTGDGYYVWSRELGPEADGKLFQFMALVLADNALACRKAVRNTVPRLRTGFHIGSHFEFYQAEGSNPGMNNYIVGDVTIELARMLDQARSGQVLIGELDTWLPTSSREGAYLVAVDSQGFVDRISRQFSNLMGLSVGDESIEFMHCYLTGQTGACAGQSVRRFRITDKHGISRNVYNLRINMRTAPGRSIILGVAGGVGNTTERRYRRHDDQGWSAASKVDSDFEMRKRKQL